VTEPTPRPGRAFAVYSALRLGLLLVCFVLLRLIVGEGNPLLVVGGAVLLSALLSLVLLRRQRDAFTAASMARADQRRAARAARRARLDDAGPDAG
jgi:LPXTG-motif cell wall-anchored protein